MALILQQYKIKQKCLIHYYILQRGQKKSCSGKFGAAFFIGL